ncbi:hypothetical protein HZC07_04670 [Candidatus Micrarchaeota archaeon]|nr:hypothetical protein [Candidatus Micrarchaeota archaeon]
MIWFILIGLLAVALILYFFWKLSSGPIDYKKEILEGQVHFTIKAKRQINTLAILEKRKKNPIELVRHNLRSGESVEFFYEHEPNSKSTFIIVECDDGKHEFEVS